MATWQVNTARDHWSELLNEAEREGPQMIADNGQYRAVVLSIDAFRSLKPDGEPDVTTPGPQRDFNSFLLEAPKIDWEDWEIERDKSVGREFNFDE